MKFSLNTSTVSALHLTEALSAPPQKVFSALTSAQMLGTWWLADGAQSVEVQSDAKPEGAFMLSYRTPSGDEVQQEGEWRAVSNDLLVLNLGPDSLHKKEGGTLVTFELRKSGGGTVISITHEGIADGSAHDRHRREWQGRLGRLKKLL